MIDGAVLGRLRQVDLREIWLTEDRGFTPWLARDENLGILSETIGLDLELEAQEKDVGPFRADILCKSLEDDSWVLIENQIERTDHRHLGQLLTYAAGLEAVTIVWIAAKFTEEHGKAMGWLNEITDAKFKFFALEVELWRIDESLPAPKFNIVAKPNDWGKRVKLAAQEIADQAQTPIRQLRARYWAALAEALALHGSRLKMGQARLDNWQDFRLGRTDAIMRLSLGARDGYLVAGVHLKGRMAGLYDAILAQRQSIEAELGFTLDWRTEPYPILNARRDADVMDEAEWPDQQEWIRHTLEKLFETFSPRVRSFDPKGGDNEDLI